MNQIIASLCRCPDGNFSGQGPGLFPLTFFSSSSRASPNRSFQVRSDQFLFPSTTSLVAFLPLCVVQRPDWPGCIRVVLQLT